MGINLELERKKLELKRVDTARADMEFLILERMAEIERIRENISKQDARMEELKQEIIQMEGK